MRGTGDRASQLAVISWSWSALGPLHRFLLVVGVNVTALVVPWLLPRGQGGRATLDAVSMPQVRDGLGSG